MNLETQNHAYWERRAESYSEVNREELAGVQRTTWKAFLDQEIMTQFAGRDRASIRILDLGAGPGFISVVLSELGFQVTAADQSEQMLLQAKQNAGELAKEIHFIVADATAPAFDRESFDVIFCRNLTWNLPQPKKAYEAWMKLLTPGGILMIFDANWYHYLVDERKKAAYEEDRAAVSAHHLEDYNIGEGFDEMEQIARQLPMTDYQRPQWDVEVLTGLGATEISVIEDVGALLYSEKEKINYASTPMFYLRAGRAR
ncbi:MAG: class I SAM-dependent methyltransferase [Lachnospiraceae bacterium]|nr:class I SAM-dependent methyltransferase [Lachnospiraceae bacterium]